MRIRLQVFLYNTYKVFSVSFFLVFADATYGAECFYRVRLGLCKQVNNLVRQHYIRMDGLLFGKFFA